MYGQHSTPMAHWSRNQSRIKQGLSHSSLKFPKPPAEGNVCFAILASDNIIRVNNR